MKVESGPAKADRNWHIVRAVVFVGFALYFIYDGAIGYPNKNRAEAKKLLQGRPFEDKVKYEDLAESPTNADFEKLLRSRPTTRLQVREALGSPTFVDGPDEYFIGRYGFARVSVTGGKVSPNTMSWKPWYKTKAEVKGQFYWAIIPAIPGLYFLWRLFKAVTLRVVIDDEGMIYGKRRITFDSMVSLRDYSPKGWIDLYYQAGAGQKKLRLDNEKVALFDEIVAAICEAKGFENAVEAHAEKKAREQAEEEPAAADEDEEEKDQPDG